MIKGTPVAIIKIIKLKIIPKNNLIPKLFCHGTKLSINLVMRRIGIAVTTPISPDIKTTLMLCPECRTSDKEIYIPIRKPRQSPILIETYNILFFNIGIML